MATGHSVVIFDDKYFDEGLNKYVEDEDVFALRTLPHGRYPTLSELRQCILEFGYALEETQDWYVTSEDDFTAIWFKDEALQEDQPVEFWFRRGYHVVLNLSQKIANRCGTLVVFNHSGYPPVLCVPDTVFPAVPPSQRTDSFFSVISRRIPSMSEQMTTASNEQALFLLSQIRSALGWADRLRQGEFFQVAQQGLSAYNHLLHYTDPRVRFLAFDLIVTFPERFFEQADTLKLAIQNESDSDTKARMMSSATRLLSRDQVDLNSTPWESTIVEFAAELLNNLDEYPPVRLAAANLLVHAQPGLLTSATRQVLVDAMVSPQRYVLSQWASDRLATHAVVYHVLESIRKLLILNHRIAILSTALPQISIAQDGHEVLRALLDNVFFGTVLPGVMSSLPDSQVAERPEIDESKFREGLSRSWRYPANPTKITIEDLSALQRSILETVMNLEVPWMVHSNLLEKYGLPPTRASVRELLNADR